jgi:hypothetical protein
MNAHQKNELDAYIRGLQCWPTKDFMVDVGWDDGTGENIVDLCQWIGKDCSAINGTKLHFGKKKYPDNFVSQFDLPTQMHIVGEGLSR